MNAPIKNQFHAPAVFEGFDFTQLAVRVQRFSDHDRPTASERDSIWRVACETIADHARAGRESAESKRVMCAWLFRFVPTMGKSPKSLMRNLERKLERFTRDGNVADRRREANKAKRAPTLSKADLDLLAATAISKFTGDLDCAWAQCVVTRKLSLEILERYSVNTAKRLRAPKAIRRQVAAEIKRLLPWHINPRAARLNGAYLERDWSNTFAGDWYSSDDITLPVYYYVEDGNGWFTLPADD